MIWWIVQNVVITTGLIALVWLIGRVGHVGPVARHALWVVVLLKFLTPPVLEWPWAVPDPLGFAGVTSHSAEPDDVLMAEVAREGSLDQPNHDPLEGGRESGERPKAPADLIARAGPWLLTFWLTGSVGLIGVEVMRLVRLSRQRLRTPADSALTTRVAELAAKLGVGPLPVVLVAGNVSPMVWGFGRPRLLWPAELPDDLDDTCIDGLLVHELAHVRRGDHLVGWLELAAGIVWWWNPLFWYVRSALREESELACDAWVISALPNGRRAYAESLIALSSAAFRGASSSFAAVGVRTTGRRILERRLVMVMKGRSSLRLSFAAVCGLVLVGTAALPTWVVAAQSAPPTPTRVLTQVVPPVSQATPSVAPSPRTPPATATRTLVPRHTVLRQQATTPAPARRPTVAVPSRTLRVVTEGRHANLTEEGQALIEALGREQQVIRDEAERRLAEKRDATVKALETLQEQYARAGKLDEAVAIRDYLRAGGPNPRIMTGRVR